MAGYPFNKKQLKNAARIYAERRNDALEASLDQEPVQFSPESQKEISSMISADIGNSPKSSPPHLRNASLSLTHSAIFTASLLLYCRNLTIINYLIER